MPFKWHFFLVYYFNVSIILFVFLQFGLWLSLFWLFWYLLFSPNYFFLFRLLSFQFSVHTHSTNISNRISSEISVRLALQNLAFDWMGSCGSTKRILNLNFFTINIKLYIAFSIQLHGFYSIKPKEKRRKPNRVRNTTLVDMGQ